MEKKIAAAIALIARTTDRKQLLDIAANADGLHGKLGDGVRKAA